MIKHKKRFILVLAVMALVLGIFTFYSLLSYNSNVIIVRVADSSQLTAKFKDALKGNGSIELTEAEANSLISLALSADNAIKDKVRDAYISITDGKINLNAVMSLMGMNFFVQSQIKPLMNGENINLKVEKVTVGKINLPQSIVTSLLKQYAPGSIKFLDDGSMDIGSKLLMFDVSDIAVGSSYVKISLKQEPVDQPQVADNTEQTTTSGQDDKSTGSNTSPAQSQPKVDPRVTMLQRTNSELYSVRNAVKTQAGKDWVNLVISANSSMMQNPDGDYSGQINSAKSVYGGLEKDVRDEIKKAALNNLDITAVRYLVNTYGI